MMSWDPIIVLLFWKLTFNLQKFYVISFDNNIANPYNKSEHYIGGEQYGNIFFLAERSIIKNGLAGQFGEVVF